MEDTKDIYNNYLSRAKTISGWEKIDKSELCRNYMKYKDTDKHLSECYFSAMICRYWPKVIRFYKETSFTASVLDCYDWLVDSILYACDKHKWDDPSSGIYNDPDGPDKVINRKMKCCRLNHLVAVNRGKRKININTLSKDAVDEATGDKSEMNQEVSSTESLGDDIMVRDSFNMLYNRKLYFLMFMYDAIINLDCFSESKLDEDKLISVLRKIKPDYIELLSMNYGIDKNELFDIYQIVIKSRTIKALKDRVYYGKLKLKELYNEMEI